jgi:5-methylthioadenosine/S-adenosylhomocysteine deaminase
VTCDLVVTGGTVLTVDPEWHLYEPGYLAVSNGTIVGVGPADQGSGWTAARTLDATGCLVMPGLVNTHTHLAMAAFRGAVEDAENRLIRYIFPLEKALVTPDLVYRASRFALAEMLKSGTTTLADMYYFEDDVARAADEARVRCLLGETVVNFAAPDAPDAHGGWAYGQAFVDRWSDHPLITPVLAPHAPYTCDPGVLRTIVESSADRGVPWMMHVAETLPETQRFTASHGSVVKYLAAEGVLGPGLVGAHMIFTDEADVELLGRHGVAVAHCPSANAKSGRPIAPIHRYLDAGLKVGLATDGPLSGNGLDLWGVANWFPKLQKVLTGQRDRFTARQAVRMATLGGAEVLGLDGVTGSLEVGKRADFLVVDATDFNVQPVYDWDATVVYALRPHNVKHVAVDGRLVVEDRRLTTLDEAQVKADMAQIAGRCRATLRALAPDPKFP